MRKPEKGTANDSSSRHPGTADLETDYFSGALLPGMTSFAIPGDPSIESSDRMKNEKENSHDGKCSQSSGKTGTGTSMCLTFSCGSQLNTAQDLLQAYGLDGFLDFFPRPRFDPEVLGIS